MTSDELCVNTIRCLAMDTVHKANSGHSGAPLGLAPAAHVLWSRFLEFQPGWLNRDRFVLSGGHGSALLYSMFHIHTRNLTLDDLKAFRQLDSKCAGHPERELIDGIEVTTGPLGQGVANAVGLALTEKYCAARYNRPEYELFNHKVYAFCGDGDLMEGIAYEAVALAGCQELDNLVLCWDDNRITICGSTDLAWKENVPDRFKACGWEVITVADANKNYEEIATAIDKARQVKGKPTLVVLKTTIGYGSDLAGSAKCHGTPLNGEQLANLKKAFGFDPEKSFYVPPEVYAFYDKVRERTQQKVDAWNKLYEGYKTAFPKEYAEIESLKKGEFKVEDFKKFMPMSNDKPLATRQTSGVCLNAINKNIPGLIGGSADLTPSTNTALAGEEVMSPQHRGGKYLEYGIREHAMMAIANAIQCYGLPGLVPFVSTFFVFVQYFLPSLRLAALEKLRVICVMTHDGIGVGEDGPTHQNVENFAVCRALPHCLLLRPADMIETSACYTAAFTGPSRPAVLCLSRQTTPPIQGANFDGALKGGYIVKAVENPKLVVVGTGTELAIAMDAAAKLSFPVQIVSMPCMDIFDEQPLEYKKSVFPKGVPVVSVEAGVKQGWEKYSHKHLGMTDFGMSAPAPKIYERVGLTAPAIAAECEKVVKFFEGRQVPDLLDMP